MRTEPERVSCGVPPTAQFARWADCVELIEQYERRSLSKASAVDKGRRPVRYGALLKVRTDLVYKNAVSLGLLLSEWVYKLTPSTIVSIDDLVLLVPRDHWHVLKRMRVAPAPNGPPDDDDAFLQCPRLCNARYRREFPDLDGWVMPTHCLMRTHFARFGVQLVDVNLMLPPETLLVDTSVRGAYANDQLGHLVRPSMIVRLRPTLRAQQQERDLSKAHDWEGAQLPPHPCSTSLPRG